MAATATCSGSSKINAFFAQQQTKITGKLYIKTMLSDKLFSATLLQAIFTIFNCLIAIPQQEIIERAQLIFSTLWSHKFSFRQFSLNESFWKITCRNEFSSLLFSLFFVYFSTSFMPLNSTKARRVELC